jgi:hypothetical protein
MATNHDSTEKLYGNLLDSLIQYEALASLTHSHSGSQYPTLVLLDNLNQQLRVIVESLIDSQSFTIDGSLTHD